MISNFGIKKLSYESFVAAERGDVECIRQTVEMFKD